MFLWAVLFLNLFVNLFIFMFFFWHSGKITIWNIKLWTISRQLLLSVNYLFVLFNWQLVLVFRLSCVLYPRSLYRYQYWALVSLMRTDCTVGYTPFTINWFHPSSISPLCSKVLQTSTISLCQLRNAVYLKRFQFYSVTDWSNYYITFTGSPF